ncbi:hypothetical protein BH09MYX1_BH09MYX1_31040 [soil metagenome]
MDHEELANAPKAGTIFAEKYLIDRVLGIGGMGFVLAARHVQLDERVAIKMLLPKLASNSEAVERFLREGRAAVRSKSEHVGRVLDVGSHGTTHFIVMEYLDGTDLAGLIEQRGRLRQHEAVDHLLQACEAIAEAHALGIVHRDLKPANLFLVHRPDGSPCVKVLDFGISKMSGPEGSASLSMTKTSSMMGSPLYMSPEQLKSAKNVDGRADIWALGVILFELLAGRPPFLAQTLPELGAMVLSGKAPDVREYAADVAPGLAEAVAMCLRPNAEERFPSIAELAFAIASFGTGAAASSSARIARVLDKIPRPSSSWIRSGSAMSTSQNQALVKTELPDDPALMATALGGVQPTTLPSAAVSGPNALRTGGSWGSATDPTPPKPKSSVRFVLGAAAIVLVGAGGLFARHALTPPSQTATATATDLAPSAPTPLASSAPLPTATQIPSPSPSTTVTASASASHSLHSATIGTTPHASASVSSGVSAAPSATVVTPPPSATTPTTSSTNFSHNSKE